YHLAKEPAGKASAGDIDEINPTGLRLDLRLRSHPPEDPLRINQEREDCGTWRWDVRLTADNECLLHRFPPRLVIPPACAAEIFSPIGGRKPAAIGLVVCAWQAVRLSVRSRLT